MNMKRYSFFISDQLKKRIEDKAAQTGTPASEHIRAAIDLYCRGEILLKKAPRPDGR